MIQPNELRIGNMVMNKPHSVMGGEDIYKIANINWNGSIMIENRIGRFEEDMEDYIAPIPLTEEWLMKAGFEIYNNEAFKIGCRIIKLDGEFLFDTKASKLLLIKHLHQLQNLYYCLCGEELKIEI